MLKQLLDTARFIPSAARPLDPAGLAALRNRLQKLATEGMDPATPLLEDIQGAALALGDREANVLFFADKFWEALELHNDMDSVLQPVFARLRPRLAAVVLEQANPDLILQHPFMELLNSLLSAARLWSSELGKAGDRYRQRIESRVAQLCDTPVSSAAYEEWRDSFRVEWQKDLQRAELLTNRIVDTDSRAVANQQVERTVVFQVNALLQRCEMPDVVEDMIKDPFRHSLQIILLSQGQKSDAWQAVINAMERLQDSMKAPKDEEEKQRAYRFIPLLPDMLRHTLVGVGDPAVMDTWLEKLEALHVMVLMGKPVPLQPATLLPVEERVEGIKLQVSSALLEQVSQVQVGSWVVAIQEGGVQQRCRLALKLEEAGHLMFANVLGAKCFEMTFEDFARLLMNRCVRLLDQDLHMSDILQETCMLMRSLDYKQQMLRAEADARESAERQRRQEAEQKAKREADILEQQRREREAVAAAAAAKVEAERQAAAALVAKGEAAAQAEQDVKSLVVGAWVEIEVDGVRQKAKLAAVINSGNKLIFTDRVGKKLVECTRAELTLKVLDQSAVVIETGKQFESSLQKVIQSLRTE